jgi:hypothetical protein
VPPAGKLADAESMVALKDLANRLGSGNIWHEGGFPELSGECVGVSAGSSWVQAESVFWWSVSVCLGGGGQAATFGMRGASLNCLVNVCVYINKEVLNSGLEYTRVIWGGGLHESLGRGDVGSGNV